MAGERAELAALAGPKLLEIALDDSLPHLLVRSFARDACEKLVAAGFVSLTPEEDLRLVRVNETPVPRVPADPKVRNTIGRLGHWDGFAHERDNRRFRFNGLDTLPYWYAPMLNSFAGVDGERFLQEAERWIIDVWGYSIDAHNLVKEPRRAQFDRSDWALTMNSHGSKPTLEPFRTHLEWNAMWCAAGELLKSEPLVPQDEDLWDDLSDRIDREKLVEPPLWSADLLVSTPLIARCWQPDKRPLDDWTIGVREAGSSGRDLPGGFAKLRRRRRLIGTSLARSHRTYQCFKRARRACYRPLPSSSTPNDG